MRQVRIRESFLSLLATLKVDVFISNLFKVGSTHTANENIVHRGVVAPVEYGGRGTVQSFNVRELYLY